MNLLKTILIALLVGIVIGAAGLFLFDRYLSGTLSPNENVLMAGKQNQQATTTTPGTAAVTTSTAPLFSWEFKDVKKAEDPYQYTQVSLVSGGKTHPVGTYQGSCKVVTATEKGLIGEYADADELSPRVQCWFAGAGDEIGLFKDGAGYSVKTGELQEGIEGGAAFRGNFKTEIPL